MSTESLFKRSFWKKSIMGMALLLCVLTARLGLEAQSTGCVEDCDCGLGTCMLSGYPGAHYAEYDSDMCAILWSPDAYDATPDNLFPGQHRFDFVPNDTCPCGNDAGIGDVVLDSPELDSEWSDCEYYTYCNHCE